MFSVIFEVLPRQDRWNDYLENAKALRPELEKVDGFVDNIRYKSLTREGWILSLSNWRDEKSVVRWRTQMRHHEVQQRGRDEILSDYHLRVGEIARDTHVPAGFALSEQRLDETEVGIATTITLLSRDDVPSADAVSLGLVENAPGLKGWDVFDSVLSPGDRIVLISWRDVLDAESFEKHGVPDEVRVRRVRVVRDYGLRDRREAPQYFAEVGTPQG